MKVLEKVKDINWICDNAIWSDSLYIADGLTISENRRLELLEVRYLKDGLALKNRYSYPYKKEYKYNALFDVHTVIYHTDKDRMISLIKTFLIEFDKKLHSFIYP